VTSDRPRAWTTRSERQADEWSLVLTAAGIPHRIETSPEGFEVHVAPADEGRLERELEAFTRETPTGPGEIDPGIGSRRSRAGFIAAGLLLGFHLLTGPRSAAREWFRTGSASAERILAGETWRTVTALTLHADAAHVIANSVSAAVFVTELARIVGPGVAAWVLLLSGTAGNALTAVARGAPHASVGASTALFGALGCLAALQAVRWRNRPRPRYRPWVPVAAGAALLAMLGTGRDADVAAHLFGFAAGLPLGVLTARLAATPPAASVQRVLVLAAAGVVVACWGLAFGTRG
jgi:membrane associated rhomboid family serine protease